MKLATFALSLLAAEAADGVLAGGDDVLDDYVEMMMRQASGEQAAGVESDLDEAIQAKHGEF